MRKPRTTIGSHLEPFNELRRARRYPLNEVVAFCWEDDKGFISRMTGITRDISVTGICFMTARQIDVGTRITLDVFLVSVSRTSQAVRLHAAGVVSRVECDGHGEIAHTIAAEIAFQEEPDEFVLASTQIH